MECNYERSPTLRTINPQPDKFLRQSGNIPFDLESRITSRGIRSKAFYHTRHYRVLGIDSQIRASLHLHRDSCNRGILAVR